jgi:L-rhamnose mutarotase
MKLKEGCCAEEYRKRHDEIWPELKEILTQSGIHDYSIFLDEETNTLFAIHKLTPKTDNDGSATTATELGSNPVVQRWWAKMADLMVFYLP